MKKGIRYLLMFGHICTDINQGALPAILPFLIASRNMGYASAASLIFAANLVSSVVQPLFGYLGDRTSRPWLMSLGIALAGSGIALIGFCRSYWAVCAAAAVSGFGIALFHPEGGKTANHAAGDRKGTGISVFAVGGNLGFALGPIVASAAMTLWGVRGTVVFLVPAYAMAAILLFFTPKLRQLAPLPAKQDRGKGNTLQRDDWGAFSKVCPVLFCRSIVHYGLTTFIPLYFVSVFMLPEAAANSKLTILSLVGAGATLCGGRLADRYGFRRVIRISYLAAVPLLLAMLGANSSLAATLLMIPIGFALNSSFSPLIAMGQSFLPNHVGFASGISLGLSVSIGGVCAPLIGWIGDRFGLMAAMYAVTGVACLALVFTWFLPARKKPEPAAKPRPITAGK